MAKAKPSDIVGKIVDLLTPLSSEDRGRVISASLTLLGEADAGGRVAVTDQADGGAVGIAIKAKAWQRQNGISPDQLGQVFHIADGKADVIVGEMPGKNKKEKTLNAYVLAGVAQLLTSGDGKFTDKAARALCTSAGCYDGPRPHAEGQGQLVHRYQRKRMDVDSPRSEACSHADQEAHD
jgi:hypothetical protein